jgi:hypothetical protein
MLPSAYAATGLLGIRLMMTSVSGDRQRYRKRSRQNKQPERLDAHPTQLGDVAYAINTADQRERHQGYDKHLESRDEHRADHVKQAVDEVVLDKRHV